MSRPRVSQPRGDSVEVPLGEVSVPSPRAAAALGLLQVNRSGERHREDLLSPGHLAS